MDNLRKTRFQERLFPEFVQARNSGKTPVLKGQVILAFPVRRKTADDPARGVLPKGNTCSRLVAPQARQYFSIL
jgi:hypothetical protein